MERGLAGQSFGRLLPVGGAVRVAGFLLGDRVDAADAVDGDRRRWQPGPRYLCDVGGVRVLGAVDAHHVAPRRLRTLLADADNGVARGDRCWVALSPESEVSDQLPLVRGRVGPAGGAGGHAVCVDRLGVPLAPGGGRQLRITVSVDLGGDPPVVGRLVVWPGVGAADPAVALAYGDGGLGDLCRQVRDV